MPFNVTPSLGADLDYNGALPYYDGANANPSPQLGVSVMSNDGHLYKWVKASALIAAAAAPGTAVTITEPAQTAAAGAGGFNAPVAGVASGAYFWARKTAL
jgi:hypothetical protein